MKTIFVHIGTFKTGTTSIQNSFHKSREILKEYGILYPLTNRATIANCTKHQSITNAAISQDKKIISSELDALLSEFDNSGCNNMVVSAEGLSGLKPCYPEFFKPLLHSYNLKAICYFRRQDYFVESLFNQFSKERERQESNSILKFSTRNNISSLMKYASLLDLWEVNGFEIIAKDFDIEVRKYGLLNSFLNIFNLPNNLIIEIASNKSPSMNMALFLNQSNRLHLNLSKLELQNLIIADRRLHDNGFPDNKYLLGKIERQKLLFKFRTENERLSSRYGIHFDENIITSEADQHRVLADRRYLLKLCTTLAKLA
jgi:hypothetical protein